MGHVIVFCFMILLSLYVVLFVAREVAENWSERRFAWEVWRRWRIHMFFEVVLLLVLTIIGIGILDTFVPITRLNIFNIWAVPKHGLPTALIATSPSTATSPESALRSTNVLLLPVNMMLSTSFAILRWVSLAFLILILLLLPFFAHWEEEEFRRGYHGFWPVIRRSIQFGLVHCLVGIPLSAGLVLCFSGLFYAWKYKRARHRQIVLGKHDTAEDEGVMVATAYHTLYNSVVLAIIIATAWTGIFC